MPPRAAGGQPDFPGRGRFLERPGGGFMHYAEAGAGPATALMAHGNPTWAYMWRAPLASLAAAGYRCLAPDHLGMGLSSRPRAGEYGFRLADRVADLTAFMAAVCPAGPVHVVAHDWGGPIALGWAVAHPGRVASVTLMNTATRLPRGYRLPWRLALFKACPPLGGLLAVRANLFARGTARFGPWRPLAPAVRDAFLHPYQNAAQRLAIGRFIEDIPLSPGHPSHGCLADIDARAEALLQRVPTALVWGERDFVFDRRVLADWRSRLPRAQTLALPQAGHYLLEDEPRAICEFLRRFLGDPR